MEDPVFARCVLQAAAPPDAAVSAAIKGCELLAWRRRFAAPGLVQGDIRLVAFAPYNQFVRGHGITSFLLTVSSDRGDIFDGRGRS
jgi:hypothetical protein